jgi:hypothetical protein
VKSGRGKVRVRLPIRKPPGVMRDVYFGLFAPEKKSSLER